MCRARSAPDSVRPNDQAEATRVGKRKWDFAPESGIVTIKLAQGSRKAKESGGNKLSRICGERFDGMNIALYILVERIRCDECQAVKQRGEGKWSNYGPQGNDQLGFDIVQPDENNWRRSAGGQGWLNPKRVKCGPAFRRWSVTEMNAGANIEISGLTCPRAQTFVPSMTSTK